MKATESEESIASSSHHSTQANPTSPDSKPIPTPTPSSSLPPSESNYSLNSHKVLLADQMATIDKWLIFSTLKPQFISSIKLACVFGCSGNEAIVTCDDDEVFALGTNSSSCLGVGDSNSSLEPRRVDVLCKKGVCSFAYGSGPHVLALTLSGDVYSWAHNGYQQLGNGTTNTNTVNVPQLIRTSLTGKKVVEIACGSHHSMALTDEGEVFAWGQNNCGQVGCGSTTTQATPRIVTSGIGGRKVVSIACGQLSSMVVLDNGELWGWGYNGNGQLGLGSNANQTTPCRVTNLNGVIIEKVACGYAHTLALSDEGILYAFGSNSYGQLGTGSKSNQISPVRTASQLGRFVEIAASHYSHISAAITQEGKCFMWGQCRAQTITQPTEVTFQSIHDVFACFSTPPITYKPMQLSSVKVNRVLNSLSQAFDDSKTSDLRFIVEGKSVHVHKAILKVRCEHFRCMFQSHWDEGEKDELEVTQFTYPVYYAFLQYLYTDEVNLPPEDAISLLDLANSYCEMDLKHKCEMLIRNGVSIENVPILYSAAIKYEAKDLEEYCFRFALVHLTSVVQTDAFRKLDEVTVKNLIVRAAQHGAFKH